MSEKKIINAHAHVFTSQFVPPYLAKTMLPWPLYYLINTAWIVRLVKWYFKFQSKNSYPEDNSIDGQKAFYKKKRNMRKRSLFYYNFKNKPYINIPYNIVSFWLTLVALFYSIELFSILFGNPKVLYDKLLWLRNWLVERYLIYDFSNSFKIFWVILVLLFINWSRKIIPLTLKGFYSTCKKVFNAKTMDLVERYILMGRFAMFETQGKVAKKLIQQLPKGSGVVILPMDMEYMEAGKPKLSQKVLDEKVKNLKKGWTNYDYQDTYKYQMRELWKIVESNRNNDNHGTYYPFIFLDPRRIAEEGKSFFNYEVKEGRMKLKECFVKTYIEDRNFSGFKIYPALGYYPFDENLLPLWRYAAENNIPIMTHCVVGTIYYRGKKKKEWNFHPIFEERFHLSNENEVEQMFLPQVKNVNMQVNFTHPMNYLCLLEEYFLKKVLKKAKNDAIRELFGYVDDDTPLDINLCNLKICLAHYGGEKEWEKYLETDRDNYSQKMVTNPDFGINFMQNSKNEFSISKINQLWHNVDWYTIISSMLIKYENLYADLSYIISKPSIYPLLNHTLKKGDHYDIQYKKYLEESSSNKKASHFKGRNRLRSHILYGTDFYVVRNHNSDKDLFIEAMNGIGKENFDLIARENTFNYLARD